MSKQIVSLDALLASLDETPQVEKVASEASPQSVAVPANTAADELKETLTKQANTEVNTDMSSPKEKGRAIAESVLALVKQAMDETAPNQVIAATSAQVASSSAGQQETPREGATVTQTLKGLAANAIATGAVRKDALDEHVDAGKDEADGHAANHEEVEKAAAVSHLVGEQGFSFDEAIALVKQAEAELFADEVEQVKQAAVAALVAEKMDIESAVELVKVAMEVDYSLVKSAASGKETTGVEKQAKEKDETKNASGAMLRQVGRSLAEGYGGMAAGAAGGAGIGAAIAKAGGQVAKPAALAGALIGSQVGSLAGGIHGSYASLKNSLNAERKEVHDMYKKAAVAIDALREVGFSTDEAIAILSSKE